MIKINGQRVERRRPIEREWFIFFFLETDENRERHRVALIRPNVHAMHLYTYIHKCIVQHTVVYMYKKCT